MAKKKQMQGEPTRKAKTSRQSVSDESGFSSAVTQKTTLTEKGESRKKTAVGRKYDCGKFRHSEDRRAVSDENKKGRVSPAKLLYFYISLNFKYIRA